MKLAFQDYRKKQQTDKHFHKAMSSVLENCRKLHDGQVELLGKKN